MAAKKQGDHEAKKRKRISGGKGDGEKSSPKKLKLPAKSPNKVSKKPFKSSKEHTHKVKSVPGNSDGNEQLSKRELRLRAKAVAEARKKKRKRHYNLEQELAVLWEKMRRRDTGVEDGPKVDRTKLVSEAIQKMKGKIPEIAGSHVSSRVLQTCVKYCTQAEREAVFDELRPHFLTLACNTYAVHLLTKMLDNASKKQLAEFISSLRGRVASLLRHMVGSLVVEHAYQLGNATQKHSILMELYATELQLFKDLVSMKERRIVDFISKLGLNKASVIRHMSSVLQPILEKGIVDHSVIHKTLMEYFSIADQSSAADVIQQLSGPLLVRMVHTRDGSRIGMLCVKHGSAKERKKLIKGLKGQINKIAHDKCGSMVLVCILSIVDDTKLITKIIIREFESNLKELVLDKNGRRPLLQLLHPNCPRYFGPDDLASLNLSIPSLCNKGGSGETSALDVQKHNSEVSEGSEKVETDKEEDALEVDGGTGDESLQLTEGGKKDPFLRRQELLVDSGLAESLITTCKESVEELLKSQFGKELLYEVAVGGAGRVLYPAMGEQLSTLHEAIATLVARPKSAEAEDEHLLENFHSSRTIRKLIIDSPDFATTLWNVALKGKCKMWAQGHSSKVIAAFMESSDSNVLKLAKKELQPLIDSGVLKVPVNRANEVSEVAR